MVMFQPILINCDEELVYAFGLISTSTNIAVKLYHSTRNHAKEIWNAQKPKTMQHHQESRPSLCQQNRETLVANVYPLNEKIAMIRAETDTHRYSSIVALLGKPEIPHGMIDTQRHHDHGVEASSDLQ